MAVTPSNRWRSSIRARFPSANTGVLAVFPRHPEALGDPGDRQVLTNKTDQRPKHSTAGELRSRFSDSGGVLPPHMTKASAFVAPDGEMQGSWGCARTIRVPPPDDGFSGRSLDATIVAPSIWFH